MWWLKAQIAFRLNKADEFVFKIGVSTINLEQIMRIYNKRAGSLTRKIGVSQVVNNSFYL